MIDNTSANTLSVTIMEREFRVACPEGAEEKLEASARFLDKKMNEIRSSGKVYGVERIAVMAALNLTHDLLNQNTTTNTDDQAIEGMIRKINQVLEKN